MVFVDYKYSHTELLEDDVTTPEMEDIFYHIKGIDMPDSNEFKEFIKGQNHE